MPKFDVNSNAYTFGFAIMMTLLVAVSLATVATGLKPIQEKQIALDKKMQILNAVAPISNKALVEAEYGKRIQEMVIDVNGKEVKGVNAFDIDIKKEYKKPEAERKLPIYIYDLDGGKKNYIIPLHGAGLWDEIWGFVALEKDGSTITGTSYGHKGETPGLGAELAKAWFQDQFKGKTLADKSDEFKLTILKGKGNAIEGNKFAVDGMSGATITSDGVEDMLAKGYKSYRPYFKMVN